MATDIQVSSLTAVGGLDHIAMTALSGPPAGKECLSYMRPAKIEFWVATTNNRAGAVKIGESVTGLFDHTGLPTPTTRYYWARAVDDAGNVGDYYPASATAGVSASTTLGTAETAINAMGNAVNSNIAAAVNVEKTERTTAVSALASQITTVEAKTDAGTATGLFRIVSSAGPSGFTTSLSMEGKVNAGGTFRSAGVFIDVSASTSRLRLVADKTVIQNAAGTILAMFESDGTFAYARIPVLNSDKIVAGVSITSPSISGGTFTGSRFQTRASGARLWIDEASNALLILNSSGQVRAAVGGSGNASAQFTNYANFEAVTVTAALTSNNAHAIRAKNSASGGGEAVLGVSAGGGGYGVNAVTGKIYSAGGYLPFTGMHECLVRRDAELELGDIVYVKQVLHRDGLDNVLTEVARTDLVGDRRVIGIVSEIKDIPRGSPLAALGCNQGDEVTKRRRRYLCQAFRHVTVNALGEGQMDVCGRGGDIGAGDYIVTSDLPGKGQRQNDASGDADDLLRRCTVAQAMEPVTFDSLDQVRRVAVFYRCG